jgi:hypothetical protein
MRSILSVGPGERPSNHRQYPRSIAQNLFPGEAEDEEAAGHELVMATRIASQGGSLAMPQEAVRFEQQPDCRVTQIHRGDPTTVVDDGELRFELREAVVE